MPTEHQVLTPDCLKSLVLEKLEDIHHHVSDDDLHEILFRIFSSSQENPNMRLDSLVNRVYSDWLHIHREAK